jgi:hypothetical protein
MSRTGSVALVVSKIEAELSGHYELALEAPPALRVAAAFTELARAI